MLPIHFNEWEKKSDEDAFETWQPAKQNTIQINEDQVVYFIPIVFLFSYRILYQIP